jgi:hypothetical protein
MTLKLVGNKIISLLIAVYGCNLAATRIATRFYKSLQQDSIGGELFSLEL